jgi:DNA replication and repair protein RecF
MRSRIRRLSLANFRSYGEASLETGGKTCFLVGPNGSGKTNLLEAISLFSPGRGLRGAAASEFGRCDPGDAESRPWAIAAEVINGDDELSIGTGVESADAVRRVARRSGESVPVSSLADFVRPLWLTPAHDRLFAGGSADRRRFLDRLVFSALPGHAADVAVYERAQRERMRLLEAGPRDRAWLEALEAQAAKSGAQIVTARAATVRALAAEIGARDGGHFPAARIDLTGDWDRLAILGAPTDEIEARLASALAEARTRDAAAGRALCGPHRGDLAVVELTSGRPAHQCSTGEQKALILNLILAQAARLSRAIDTPNPILLLDEVAAHLDATRRSALFDVIDGLTLQAFLSGTDDALFESIRDRALGVRVEASILTVMER